MLFIFVHKFNLNLVSIETVLAETYLDEANHDTMYSLLQSCYCLI